VIVALLGTLACEQEERLRAKVVEPMQFVPLPDEAPTDRLTRSLAGAEAIVTMRYDRTMPPAPRLGLLHVGGTGYDDIDLGYLPSGAVVCNASGHEIPIAEYVVLAMLQWCSRFIEAERSFRVEGSWRLGGRSGAPYHDELDGKTVGILGFGGIGRALAPRARALGTTVVACTRTPRPAPDVDRMMGPGELDLFLGCSDFVVVCCSLTPETNGLLDRDRLGRMKPTAVLINVSRGPIVDEDALFEALRARTIGGAVIDAWYRYPSRGDLTVRPSRHPFHQLDNVYMTPHSSAWTLGMIERRWATIAGNLDRFCRGEPLDNVVYRAA
jgi:phosphoglycerate dehydrogenase-like enzyme